MSNSLYPVIFFLAGIACWALAAARLDKKIRAVLLFLLGALLLFFALVTFMVVSDPNFLNYGA